MNEADFAPTAEAVRAALNAQGFLHLLGAHVDEIAYGRVVMSVARRPELLQQQGFFHGGVIGFLADNSTTAAAATIIDREHQSVLTAEYKLNLLAPAKGESLVCIASVVKPSRMLTVVEAKIFCEAEGGRKLVAIGLATIANLDRTALAVAPPGQS